MLCCDQVDADYIEQALEIFGRYDEDGDGTIGWIEFGQIWEHLELGAKLRCAQRYNTRVSVRTLVPPACFLDGLCVTRRDSGMDAIVLGDHGMPQTAQSVFRKYDTNGDGVLDQDEVAAMMDDLDMEAEDSYVDGVLDVFGRFDTDGGGSIGLNEFPALWTHLGGAPLQDASMDASGLSEDQMLAVLKKFFRKYDPLRNAKRIYETVRLYNTPQKFQHLCNQLFTRYGEHPITIWRGKEQQRPRDRICEKHVRAVESHIKRGGASMHEAEQLLRSYKIEGGAVESTYHEGPQFVGSSLSSVERSQHRLEVTFDDPQQRVGLVLAHRWSAGVHSVRVQSIQPRSLASRCRELSQGLTVERIDGTPVESLRMELIEKMLLRRPVTVVFGSGGAAQASAAALAQARRHVPEEDEEDESQTAYEQRIVGTRAAVREARDLGMVSVAQYDAVKSDEWFLANVAKQMKLPPVEVTFAEPGNLGIIFTAKSAEAAPVIASIEARSLAADVERLVVGLQLTKLQGQPVGGKPFRQVIRDLQTAECPLTLEFRKPIEVRERRTSALQQRPYRQAVPWAVKPSAGQGGVVIRALPSSMSTAVGRAGPNSILQAVGREGDWLQVEWSGARQAQSRWERARNAADDGKAWALIVERTTGTVMLEQASGASYFSLGQDRSNVDTDTLQPEALDEIVREMQVVARSDDEAAMARVLQQHADAVHADGRLHQAWQDLGPCLAAHRAEEQSRQQVQALSQSLGAPPAGVGRFALARRGGSESWARRERAVAASLQRQ